MIPIIAPPSAPLAVVRRNAAAVPAQLWYQKALTAFWAASFTTGVDPVVMAAQCALETGWGVFGGAVTAQFGNTAGMKTRVATGDTASDFAQYAIDIWGYPYVGALAHAHHLCLYAGVPVPVDTPDLRATFIGPGTAGFGSAPSVEDLSGRWATGADYGTKIAVIVERLRKE